MTTSSWNRGSEWHRWDPHIHTPSTTLNNQFGDDWDRYLKEIESAAPQVEALGITDYCTIQGYKDFLEQQKKGRAPNVRFVFPNVEFRYDVQTERKRGINVHLLFSPEDTKHVEEIERALAELTFTYKKKYHCTVADLRELGRAFDPKQKDDRAALAAGVEQFKLSFHELKELFAQNPWVRANCLVAVAASAVDGTAGLQNDSAFKALRSELEAFAHVIFSSQPGDREFWLGRKAGHDRNFIEREYRSLKPCLHGSDAHRSDDVLKPAGNRRCWIRANLTFVGLKQTLIEPESRVYIGPEAPAGPPPSHCISNVAISGAPWLKTHSIELNDGLVAIIGPKGSGKTALADFVARAAGAEIHEGASFLYKAKDLLGPATVGLEWADHEIGGPRRLNDDAASEAEPAVRYLSQQFVDRLCSAEAMTGELLAEIEAVVFQSVPDEERLGSASFSELRDIKLAETADARTEILARIQELTDQTATEEGKKAKLQTLEASRTALNTRVEKAKKDLQALLPKDKKQQITQVTTLQEVHSRKDKDLQAVKLMETRLSGLTDAYSRLKASVLRDFDGLKDKYGDCGIPSSEWETLRPAVPATHEGVFRNAKEALEKKSEVLLKGDPKHPSKPSDPATWSISELKEKIDKLTAEIGLETDRAKKHGELQRQVTELERQLGRATTEIEDAKQAEGRRMRAVLARREAYAELFGLFAREQLVLESLYAPLKARLADDKSLAPKLEFEVRRNVDLAQWVERGENLLDLRKQGAFQGRGRLAEVTKEKLLAAWRTGDAATVAGAIDVFLNAHMKDLVDSRAASASFQDVGRWLFSADHVSLVYGIRYEGLELSLLSPGMRGIVLLMLYLAIDQWDLRPLVVDQPEENLDPQSVYDELVGYFREAKRRRQIILVTHNPNLVVNADADQVIVAHAKRSGTGLPELEYTSGGLEDEGTRRDVCRILEGGERAFRDREQRYAFPDDARTSASVASAAGSQQ